MYEELCDVIGDDKLIEHFQQQRVHSDEANEFYKIKKQFVMFKHNVTKLCEHFHIPFANFDKPFSNCEAHFHSFLPKYGVSGRRGVGKTTLITALADCDILPSHESMACTAVPVYMYPHEDEKSEHFRVTIHYMSFKDIQENVTKFLELVEESQDNDDEDESIDLNCDYEKVDAASKKRVRSNEQVASNKAQKTQAEIEEEQYYSSQLIAILLDHNSLPLENKDALIKLLKSPNFELKNHLNPQYGDKIQDRTESFELASQAQTKELINEYSLSSNTFYWAITRQIDVTVPRLNFIVVDTPGSNDGSHLAQKAQVHLDECDGLFHVITLKDLGTQHTYKLLHKISISKRNQYLLINCIDNANNQSWHKDESKFKNWVIQEILPGVWHQLNEYCQTIDDELTDKMKTAIKERIFFVSGREYNFIRNGKDHKLNMWNTGLPKVKLTVFESIYNYLTRKVLNGTKLLNEAKEIVVRRNENDLVEAENLESSAEKVNNAISKFEQVITSFLQTPITLEITDNQLSEFEKTLKLLKTGKSHLSGIKKLGNIAITARRDWNSDLANKVFNAQIAEIQKVFNMELLSEPLREANKSFENTPYELIVSVELEKCITEVLPRFHDTVLLGVEQVIKDRVFEHLKNTYYKMHDAIQAEYTENKKKKKTLANICISKFKSIIKNGFGTLKLADYWNKITHPMIVNMVPRLKKIAKMLVQDEQTVTAMTEKQFEKFTTCVNEIFSIITSVDESPNEQTQVKVDEKLALHSVNIKDKNAAKNESAISQQRVVLKNESLLNIPLALQCTIAPREEVAKLNEQLKMIFRQRNPLQSIEIPVIKKTSNLIIMKNQAGELALCATEKLPVCIQQHYIDKGFITLITVFPSEYAYLHKKLVSFVLKKFCNFKTFKIDEDTLINIAQAIHTYLLSK